MTKITRLVKQHSCIKPNFVYDSYWINKFVNKFIKHGKKSCVEKEIYNAFSKLKQNLRKSPVDIILYSIEVLKPILGTAKLLKYRGRKRRRKMILIPIPLSERRKIILSNTWLVNLIKIQKKSRRRHRFLNKIKELKKNRGISKSKKKTFYDRFHVAKQHQQLYALVYNKLRELFLTNFAQLISRKLSFYILSSNIRPNYRFRWV